MPLPADLLNFRTERRSGSRRIAYGRLPGDFHNVIAFSNARLPAAGFSQHDGQIDPHDAEANSTGTGTGTQGRWTTGNSPDCPGTSEISLLVLPAGTAPSEERTDADKNH